MGLPLKILLFIIALLHISLEAAEAPPHSLVEPNRILFLMQAGNQAQAINLYNAHAQQQGHHDLELLRQIGMSILDQGSNSDDPEIVLLSIFGAGISANDKAIYILQDGLKSKVPQLQLVAMNFLSRLQNDDADLLLTRIMNSNYLILRLEGAYHLAQKKAPIALAQTEALMNKVDPEFWPIFPQLYAMIGSADAMRTMRKLLANPRESVRVAAIVSVGEYNRDDLLPTIRTLSTHHVTSQQEACAYVLGKMKDESSVDKLESMTKSGSKTVRLAAWQALYRLGRKEWRTSIEEAASKNDLFAITILGEVEGSENLLFQLTQSQNLHVRTNAALSLLRRHDVRCLKPLCDILIHDARDLAFTQLESPSGALTAYKVIPSATQNLEENAVAIELSLALREKILMEALELPEADFLLLANTLFETHQNDLVPTLVEALETLRSPAAIALLKRHQQKAGAPLIRNYCNLALYRLKEEGPYAENLHQWIAKEQHGDLIHFRPFLPWELRKNTTYQLNPQETSRLLIESFEAMIQNQDDQGVDVLLHAIQHGNAKNKYALAGLLIHAAQ